jgi:hypothetical protein
MNDSAQKNKLLLLGIGIFALVVIALIFLLVRKPNLSAFDQSINSQISGVLDINGVVPSGATVSLIAQDLKGGSPVTFTSGLIPLDNDSWSYTHATPSNSYSIKAQLIHNGKIIAQSSPITVTAPADEETLTLDVTSDQPSEANAVISGDIIVNGYIPANSTITINGRVLGAQTFTQVANNLPGRARQFMSYTSAIAGKEYEVTGTLIGSDGSVLGTSALLAVAAPALNETLTINSSAQAPVTPTPTPLPPSTTSTPTPTPTPNPNSVISGSINFNGIAPANSRIVILQKPYNSSNYQVAVDNITPIDNMTWRWTNPRASTWYDLIAVLKQKQSDGTDKDLASSSMASIAAPASNVTFTLNSGITLSPPPGPINISCGNLSGSNWYATVTFGGVSGAGTYWYQIGTSNGGSQTLNSTQNANGNSPASVQIQLNNGTQYYARYAYSNLPNQGTGGSQFSPFTGTTSLQCNQ